MKGGPGNHPARLFKYNDINTKDNTMKPTYKSGAFRYSNAYVVPEGLVQPIPGSDDYTDLTATGTATSSGSGFSWDNFLSNLLSAASSVSSSIWGRNNQWQAQAYSTMYEQERRTNTILWVVIGLVVALGVFLVIRKSK